jgi:hypothetical protein
MDSEETCKSKNLKVCPSDNENNFYCVGASDPCPIRELRILKYRMPME